MVKNLVSNKVKVDYHRKFKEVDIKAKFQSMGKKQMEIYAGETVWENGFKQSKVLNCEYIDACGFYLQLLQ